MRKKDVDEARDAQEVIKQKRSFTIHLTSNINRFGPNKHLIQHI